MKYILALLCLPLFAGAMEQKQKELASYNSLPGEDRYLIFALKLAQKQFHLPNDLIPSLAAPIIADNSSSFSARTALVCHLFHSTFPDKMLLSKALAESNLSDEGIYNLVRFAEGHGYHQAVPFLRIYDTRTSEEIYEGIRTYLSTSDFTAITQICSRETYPQHGLWQQALDRAIYEYKFVFNYDPRNEKQRLEELIKLIYIQGSKYGIIDINKRYNLPKETILMLAARYTHSVVFVQWLLEHGADKTIQNNEGNTPLHLAIRAGNIRVLPLLCDPVIINHKNDDGNTALQILNAYFPTAQEIADFLREQGAHE